MAEPEDRIDDKTRLSRENDLKQFCDTFPNASPAEALEYLHKYGWNLDAAVGNYLEKSLDRRCDMVGSSASGTVMNAIPISSIRLQEQQAPSRDELIVSFMECALGSDVQDATNYLERFKWDLNVALNSWMDTRRPTHKKSSYPAPMFGSSSLAMVTADDVSPHIGSSSSLLHASGSSSSCFMDTEVEDIPPMISNDQERSQNWKETWPEMRVWVDQICDVSGVSRAVAHFNLEASEWDFDVAMEACCNRTLSPGKTASPATEREESTMAAAPVQIGSRRISSAPEHPSQLNDELIKSVCEVTGAPRDNAIFCLKMCNYDPNKAIDFLMFKEEKTLRGVPPQSQIQASHQSSSSSINAQLIEAGSSHVEAGEESVTVMIPGIGRSVPSQLQIQSSHESSSSLINAEPNKTESSHEQSSEGSSISLATPEIALSRVDEGNDAVKEDSVTFKIELADGRSVSIPFSLHETVRDIHVRIGNIQPDDNRDYYLMSTPDGAEFKDPNVTVQQIIDRKCESLLQVYDENN